MEHSDDCYRETQDSDIQKAVEKLLAEKKDGEIDALARNHFIINRTDWYALCDGANS